MMERLYENRKTIGDNLLLFIKLKGYTKTSFAKVADISRPTLNQIIEGNSPNARIFEEQIKKITDTLHLPLTYFISVPGIIPEKWQYENIQYSDRADIGKRTPLAQELLDDLDELLNISAFYVKG